MKVEKFDHMPVGRFTGFGLINISGLLVLLKIMDINRYIAIIEWYMKLIENISHKNFKKYLMFISIMAYHLMLFLVVEIQIEIFFAMRSIKPLFRSTEILIEYHDHLYSRSPDDTDFEKNEDNFKRAVSFESLNTFYFIVVTLTQLGNQDPALQDFKQDYMILTISMMMGIVFF